MDRSNVVSAINRTEERNRLGRWRRLAANPWKMVTWRFASEIAQWTGKPLKFRARMATGDKLVIYAPEAVSRQIYENTIHEPQLSRQFLELIQPGWVIYDVGAHFGYFSLLASRLTGETGFVHSFEPTPSTRRVLAENTSSLTNQRVVGLAAWSKQTHLQFHDLGIASSAFNSAFQPRTDGDFRGTSIDVQATTLDDYASENGFPNFVKIDAESAEFRVIEGMQSLLANVRPIISVEVGDLGVPGVPTSREMIDSVLAFDYVVAQVIDGRLSRVSPIKHYGYDNVILAPGEAISSN